MASLISELQCLAVDQKASVTELMQKCLIAAVKLDVLDLQVWVRQELDGYGESEVPDYRKLTGQPVVHNPYHGYQPLVSSSPALAKTLSKMPFNQPIGEIEHSLQHSITSKSESIVMSYSPEFEMKLRKGIKFGLSPALQISVSQFKKILDAVRKAVLEWSLTLEKDGILGDGMSFSEAEKQSAKQVTFTIDNYFAGAVTDSQVQIGTVESAQSRTNQILDIEALRLLINHLEKTVSEGVIAGESAAELRADIDTLKAQVAAPRPNSEIVRITLGSVRSIAEGVVLDLAKAGILQLVGRVFGA